MGVYERFRSRGSAAVLLAGLLLLGGACSGTDGDSSCNDFTVQPIQVSSHSSTGITNGRASQILAAASDVLQTDDGADDVPCCVTFQQDGAVSTFTDGDGSIDSRAEFTAVIGLPGTVKVVNQINWCGSFAPNIIGCAPRPGNSLTVIRFAANQEGILWAHEYGHTRGLSHRSDRGDLVMFPSIGTNRVKVNEAESVAFRD